MDADAVSPPGEPGTPPVAAASAPASTTPRFVGGDGVAIPPPDRSQLAARAGDPAPLDAGFRRMLEDEKRRDAVKLPLVVALHVQGKTKREIAALTELKPRQVERLLRTAREQKQLLSGVEDALVTFQQEAVPLAMEGLTGLLRRRDKDAIFKTLDGAGITGAKDKGGAAGLTLPALTVNVVMPPHLDPSQPIPIPGQAVGSPHVIDVTPEPVDGA